MRILINRGDFVEVQKKTYLYSFCPDSGFVRTRFGGAEKGFSFYGQVILAQKLVFLSKRGYHRLITVIQQDEQR